MGYAPEVELRSDINRIYQTINDILQQFCNESNWINGKFMYDGLAEMIGIDCNNVDKNRKEEIKIEKWSCGKGLDSVSIRVHGLQGNGFRRANLTIEKMRSLALELLSAAQELEDNEKKKNELNPKEAKC